MMENEGLRLKHVRTGGSPGGLGGHEDRTAGREVGGYGRKVVRHHSVRVRESGAGGHGSHVDSSAVH